MSAFLRLGIVNKGSGLHKSSPMHQDFQALSKRVLWNRNFSGVLHQKTITKIPSHCLSVLPGYSEKEIMNSVCERVVWVNVEENKNQ